MKNNNIDDKSTKEPLSKSEKTIFKLLISLTSATVIGVGVLSIMISNYYGSNPKHGYHDIFIDGIKAQMIGGGYVFIGLMLMGVWFNLKKYIILWMIVCFLCSMSFFILALK